MNPEPTPEHAWLKHLVGEWTVESECPQGSDAEPLRSTGTETVRMQGELWAMCEMAGTIPGGPHLMTALLTIGYDPRREKFVGNFVCSVMTSMFVYEGSLDADRRVLTLDTSGPGMEDASKTTEYQDIIELQEDGSRLFRSQYKGDDGAWLVMMRAVYQRVG